MNKAESNPGRRRGRNYWKLPAPQMEQFTLVQLYKLQKKFMFALSKGSTDWFTRSSVKTIAREQLRRRYAKRPKLYVYWFKHKSLEYVRTERNKRLDRLISLRITKREAARHVQGLDTILSLINISAN